MQITLRHPFPLAAPIPDLVEMWCTEVHPLSNTTGRRYPGPKNTANAKAVVDPADWAGFQLAKSDDEFAERVLNLMPTRNRARVLDAMRSWRAKGFGPSKRGMNFHNSEAAPAA